MKIILEPTESAPAFLSSPRVEITIRGDDIGLPVLVPHIRNALVAWRFEADSVLEYMPEPE